MSYSHKELVVTLELSEQELHDCVDALGTTISDYETGSPANTKWMRRLRKLRDKLETILHGDIRR